LPEVMTMARPSMRLFSLSRAIAPRLDGLLLPPFLILRLRGTKKPPRKTVYDDLFYIHSCDFRAGIVLLLKFG
jgi:hypothetical protein